ncbi:hypothetical protein AQZ59_01422 [Trueperella bernardiae]|uniref:Uncharacterized protein n=1 Tax=Trueperella bernardiae TaxID=59561 RepID=A0A0W1KJV7_9ACTO|nr:hypothetical protein AQZ59_01422 [Trueperella bernardiae]
MATPTKARWCGSCCRTPRSPRRCSASTLTWRVRTASARWTTGARTIPARLWRTPTARGRVRRAYSSRLRWATTGRSRSGSSRAASARTRPATRSRATRRAIATCPTCSGCSRATSSRSITPPSWTRRRPRSTSAATTRPAGAWASASTLGRAPAMVTAPTCSLPSSLRARCIPTCSTRTRRSRLTVTSATLRVSTRCSLSRTRPSRRMGWPTTTTSTCCRRCRRRGLTVACRA